MTFHHHPDNHLLRRTYRWTAHVYDLLDYPWERQYRQWRPRLVGDLHGEILEAGVGTGHNLAHYPTDARVTGIDLSETMLAKAKRRAQKATCRVLLKHADAVTLDDLPADHFDAYIATFLYCVMPDELQPAALAHMTRVLKPGGKFRLVEIQYSRDPLIRRRQQRLAPFVQRVYGARFDRRTLEHLKAIPELEIERTSYLKDDTYLLIEGRKTRTGKTEDGRRKTEDGKRKTENGKRKTEDGRRKKGKQ